jgi:DNA-binding NtrC family response regulator
MGVLTGKRVLLLEDEVFIAFDAEEILLSLGADDVVVAHNLSAARACLESQNIDCAMLDRNLNGEYSDELARELAGRGMPLIVASGYGPLEGNSEIVTVSKPYDESMIELAFRRSGLGGPAED